VRALLDLSVLIAIFDEEHVHHERAQLWWADNGADGWASCPLTQNGVVRVLSQPSYSHPIAIGEAFEILAEQIANTNHVSWPDDLSLLDPKLIDHTRILGPKQLTDIYLLALAVKNGGRLATFDRTIPVGAVRGAGPHHVVVI
jgi:uncharacterized protein